MNDSIEEQPIEVKALENFLLYIKFKNNELDYFEIFMQRTMMCKYAAKYLKIWFELIINDTKLL